VNIFTKQRISVPGSLSLRQSNSIQFFRHPKARCHPSRHSLHSTATHLSHSPTTISNCAYQTTPQPHLSQNLPQTPTYHNTYTSPTTMSSPLSTRRLFHEYQLLCKHSPDGITAGPISEDDIFTWEALIPGPADTPYEGGVFVAEMKFPRDYPLSPPTMRFVGDVWHPNGNPTPPPPRPPRHHPFPSQKQKLTTSIKVYPTGLVCISILHAPGEDPHHYEQASERWSPIQSVEKILISVMSMLAEPNDESPANVEAAKMWREDRGGYERRVREGVRRSLGL